MSPAYATTCAVCGAPNGIVHVAVEAGYQLVCWGCLIAGRHPVGVLEPEQPRPRPIGEEDEGCS